jgi:HSP20 family protein
MPAKDTNVTTVKAQPPARPQSAGAPTPFHMLERFADEVTRVFDDFGLGRGWSSAPAGNAPMTWAPHVDVTQHKDELLIRADLPGMEKDDVKVSVTDDAVLIRGERHRAQDEERDGVYRSERSYGSFYRAIALPAGAATDQVKASFNNGVLEIRMPAAPGAVGRPVEVSG